MAAGGGGGAQNSWRPDYCVSGLLPLVKQNFIDVEEVYVRTPTGPGGRAGPLRVDFEHAWHGAHLLQEAPDLLASSLGFRT